MTFDVQSEAGQLRQVIVHRPGLELSRLTPRNVGELLFDDVLWAKRAKEEHDAFVEALREKGVRVHYFGQLLGETLELPEGRAFVLDRLCTPEMLGPNLIAPLREPVRPEMRLEKRAHKLVGRLVQHLGTRPVPHNPAALQHDQALGELQGLAQVVRDEHHGPRRRMLQAEKLTVNLCPRHRVEGTERFVQEKDRRVEHHGAAQADPLLLAAA